MRGRKTALVPVLSPEEHSGIERLARSTTARAGLARRARAILLVSQGNTLTQVAETVGLTIHHVSKWCRRFISAPPGKRLEALLDRKGRGRKPRFSPCGSHPYHQDCL